MGLLSKPPDVPTLPYNTIREPFETAFQSAINQTEREWPRKWAALHGANAIVERQLRACWNTWNSIRFLCAQDNSNPHRKVEYALSAGPLSRTILDSLFTLVFLFQDLPARWLWYTKSGWRETHEELARVRQLYGDNPDWRDWIDGYSQLLQTLKHLCELTPDEARDPTTIRWWPIPGQMLRHPDLSDDRRTYLQFLNDWHYKALSAQSHLSLPGLIMRSQALMPASHQEEHRQWYLEKQRSDAIITSILLSLALISEVEIECTFGLKQRLVYVWTVLADFVGIARELYDRRYRAALL